MFRLASILLLCIQACATTNVACNSYQEGAMECSGVRVRHVPLLPPAGLQLLLLTGTAIATLDERSFRGRGLAELKTLHVTGGRLAGVRARAFCQLPALAVLHLDHNQLETLDGSSFSCNSLLRTVSLAGNPGLRQLPRLESSSLERLYLDNCSLAGVDAGTFESLPALKVLSLTGNPGLHCAPLVAQLKRARPNLLVTCRDHAPLLPDDPEHTPAKSPNESDSAIENERKDSTVNSAPRIPLSATTIACIFIVTVILC